MVLRLLSGLTPMPLDVIGLGPRSARSGPPRTRSRSAGRPVPGRRAHRPAGAAPGAGGWHEALTRAEQAQAQQPLPAARDAAERVWHGYGGDLPAEARARPGFLLACSLYRMGRFVELLAQRDAIVDALCATGQTESACQVLRWIALGVTELGHFEAGLQAARQGLKLAEGAGLVRMRVLLANALAACFERMGDPGRPSGCSPTRWRWPTSAAATRSALSASTTCARWR